MRVSFIPCALASVLSFACFQDTGGGLGNTTASSFPSTTTGAPATTTSPTTSAGESTTGAPDATTTTTTTTTTGTSAGSTTETTEAGCPDGTCPPDQGSANACDVWMQDCPDGQKCVVASPTSTNCVDVVDTPAGVGEPCMSLDDVGSDNCDVGAVCAGDVCIAQCGGSPDAPTCVNPGATCVLLPEDSLALCLPGCHPLEMNCADKEVCIPDPMNGIEFVCVFDASGDAGKLYDPCMFANGCDSGLMCVDSMFAYECDHGSPNCCLRFCDVGGMKEVCTGLDQQCVAWYEPGMEPPGFSDVGICIVPF